MNQEQIDAGFDQVRSERFLLAHLSQARDAGFWRALNPHLTISDDPPAAPRASAPVDPSIVETAARQIVEEGYLQTPPLLPLARATALRAAAEQVVAAGFPAVFTCVYDQFYQAFHGLDALFAPLLADGYLMVLQGLATYVVPAGDPVYRRWTTVAPHRDTLGPDPRVIARQTPSIINV